MELSAGLFPPDREMLTDRPSEVRTMGGGLCHQLMERDAGTLPRRPLHAHKKGENDGGRETEHPSVGG